MLAADKSSLPYIFATASNSQLEFTRLFNVFVIVWLPSTSFCGSHQAWRRFGLRTT